MSHRRKKVKISFIFMVSVNEGKNFFFDCGLVNYLACVNIGGSKGVRVSPPPHPSGFKFFQFHAVFGKFWQNHMFPPSPEAWHPLLRGILDPPLYVVVLSFNSTYYSECLCCENVVKSKFHSFSQNDYRSGTVNSKSFVGKVLLWIKRKFELTYAL